MNNHQFKTIKQWSSINWRSAKENIFRIQMYIYKTSKNKQTQKVHELQNLLMKLPEAKLIAVRQVTQENKGRKTAGVDGIKSLEPKQRLELAKGLKIDGKADPILRVWIEKPGKKEKRPLGIPTIRDRAKQALMKIVLEPEWEALFSPNMYGFRPGRSIRDAHKQIRSCLIVARKLVFKADIEKCFDRINHDCLLDKLSQNRHSIISKQIQSWLKCGAVEQSNWIPNERGTPQGGVISPLLANIALCGLEEAIHTYITESKGNKRGVHTIIYADDIITLTANENQLEATIQATERFLLTLGLNLNWKKSNRTNSQKGFESLGCQITQRPIGRFKIGKTGTPWKVYTLPTKKTVDAHFANIKYIARTSATNAELVRRMNPIIKGFKQFAQCTDVGSSGMASKWNTQLYKIIETWGRRRGIRGKNPKLYTSFRGRDWTPYAVDKGKTLHLDNYYVKGDHYSLNQYIKVRGAESPYNGDWMYWGKRPVGDTTLSENKLRLLKRQKGRCPICKKRFIPMDVLQTDHIIPTSEGGTNTFKNLQLLHSECHAEKTHSR